MEEYGKNIGYCKFDFVWTLLSRGVGELCVQQTPHLLKGIILDEQDQDHSSNIAKIMYDLSLVL